ncbi:MAG: hypothetical protein AAGL49_06425 [Pseudomonadota bacterium]
MSDLRAAKVDAIADFIPDQPIVQGAPEGRLCVLGWGSTHGAIWRAVTVARSQGFDVAQIHLRHIHPLPKNLKALLSGYERVLLPEMNMGQCATLIRDKLGVEVVQLNKVSGQPFKISEILAAIAENHPPSAQAAE